jgi:hypothetical protein
VVLDFDGKDWGVRGLERYYLWLFAEAEPGESHELSLAVGEGVLGIDGASHAGVRLVGVSKWS